MKQPIKLGLLGKQLSHSLSPEIHNFLLKKQGFIGDYQTYALNEQELPYVLSKMANENILGLNVTIPYKETLFQMVDHLDEHARAIGAINTIHFKDGITYGYNTDYLGVIGMFKKAHVTLKGKDITILGSGGAAKALVYAFQQEKAKHITVAARNQEACLALQRLFPYIHICDFSHITKGDLIVNTTPVGMFPHVANSPVDRNVLTQFAIAGDIVYNPFLTKFLTLAKKEGLTIVTGLMMLVDQAIAAEEIWLGKQIDDTLGNEIHDRLKGRF
ncbi:MAG: shikimate dehydrogenase [Lachnospiraceae bacterium]|nr:shikimate dehydrogenase [Lachnospiraceae bacterium]